MSPGALPPRPPRRELRMPLQVGSSSSVDAVLLAGLLGNTFALAAAHLPGGGVVAWGATAAAGALLLAATAYTWSSLSGSRACDLVLGPAGIRIEGGPRHGLARRWTELDPARCRVENDRVQDTRDQPIRGRQLWIGLADGSDLLLAEVYQNLDRPPLYVAIDEIRGAYGLPPLADEERTVAAQAPPVRPAIGGVEELRCPSCGHAAPPVDAPVATCATCGAGIEVPLVLRERVRRSAERSALEVAADAASARLRAQPDARTTNRRLLLAVLAMGALPVAGGLAELALLRAGGGGACDTLALAVVVASLVCAVSSAIEPVFVSRVALRSCLSELGARRRAEDAQPCCRSCAALLPDGPPDGRVTCSWCGVQSLLVEDLRGWDGVTRQQTLEGLLEARDLALARARSSRRIFVGLAVIAAVAPLCFGDLR